MRAKTTIRQRVDLLPREKLVNYIEKELEKAPLLYLEGEVGCGKTSLVISYLQHHEKIVYGYLQFDEKDNDPETFAKYLYRMGTEQGLWSEPDTISDTLMDVSSVAVPGNETEIGKKDVEGVFQYILENLEQKNEECILVFDQIQELKEESLLKEMKLFFHYLPEHCKVLLLSRDKLPESWQELLFQGRLGILPAEKLMFDKLEIRDFFYLKREPVSAAEASEIYDVTGGWPGAVAMHNLHHSEGKSFAQMEVPYFYFFLQKHLWKRLDEEQVKLLQYGQLVPFFNCDFCEKVFQIVLSEEKLFEMKNAGILNFDGESGQYRISRVLQVYLEKNDDLTAESQETSEVLERAALWYETHSYLREMFACIENPQIVEKALIYYAPSMLRKMSLSEIKRYLKICDVHSNQGEMLLLRGWVASQESRFDDLDEMLHQMRNQWETNKENAQLLEYYLNLLFYDPRVDICAWLYQIEDLWNFEKKLHLYTYANGNPVFCCGVKNFAPMFVGKLKEERNYIRIWKDHLDEEAGIALDITKYSFYIQTERHDKVYENIQALYRVVMKRKNSELYAGLYYLMYGLQRARVPYDFTREMHMLMEKVYAAHETHVKDNCRVIGALLTDYLGGEEEISYWLLYDSPEEDEKNVQENAYLLLLKAKAYLTMKQYAKATNLCERLADYYEKNNLDQMLADCLFIQAVALYERDKKNEALMKATKALTVGAKYRYLNLYIQFGATGVALIEEYHKLTGLQISEKKQYYYGNVLRANYEGYQSILLRTAKKAKRAYGSEMKKEELVYGRLTMTELAILRYINNGLSNQEIGEIMNIKVTTVKTHVYNIYRKLGVSTRVQAINEGKEQGLIG